MMPGWMGASCLLDHDWEHHAAFSDGRIVRRWRTCTRCGAQDEGWD